MKAQGAEGRLSGIWTRHNK